MEENGEKSRDIANDIQKNDNYYDKKRRFVIKWLDKYMWLKYSIKVENGLLLYECTTKNNN